MTTCLQRARPPPLIFGTAGLSHRHLSHFRGPSHPAGPEDWPQEGAVARKLAVILHRMWRDGTEFRWSNKEAAVTAP
jgi:hypothetical protein